MAVSDTLFEAIEEIRDCLASNPGMYGTDRPQIEALLAEMQRVRVLLDTPPLLDANGRMTSPG
jgi:hypothetical protein